MLCRWWHKPNGTIRGMPENVGSVMGAGSLSISDSCTYTRVVAKHIEVNLGDQTITLWCLLFYQDPPSLRFFRCKKFELPQGPTSFSTIADLSRTTQYSRPYHAKQRVLEKHIDDSLLGHQPCPKIVALFSLHRSEPRAN